jgi:hypothetical protein
VTSVALLVGCTLLLVPCLLRLGVLHPVTVTLALWVLIGVGFVVGAVDVVPPGGTAVAAILLGLGALCLAPVWLPPPGSGAGDGPVTTLRVGWFAAVVVAVLGIVGWGVLAFRAAVSASLGIPFADADPQLVRYAELFGDLQLSGPASLAFGLAPLLGALAVVGGLLHRAWWYLLLPVGLALTMQSPSRTATITLAVTALFFFLALSRAPGAGRRRPDSGRTTLLLGAAGAAGVAYFGWVGTQLGKTDLPAALHPASWVPEALLQPVLYQLGGVSAFTAELARPDGGPGPYGAPGRSLYALVRLAEVLGVPVHRPAPFAAYVDIPAPFNTYTAIGDTYVDLGMAGVVVVFGLLGFVVAAVGRWPHPGNPAALWVGAVLASVLIATPVHMRVLDGDVLVAAVLGWLALTLTTRRTAGAPAALDPGPVGATVGSPP